jgi:hypothetical protein
MPPLNNPGPKIIGIQPKLTEDQLAIVEVCKETLAQALEGSITTIGVIACMKASGSKSAGYATVFAGRQASDLNMGCDSLKLKILRNVERAGEDTVRNITRQ